MSEKRVTLADIAARIGVTKATISMALRDDPRISVAMRERVKVLAKEMNYRPDPALAAVARFRWANRGGSGAVLAYLVDSGMPNLAQQRQFVDSARTRAAEFGFGMEEFDLALYADARVAGRVLYARGIRGILVPQFAYTAKPHVLDIGVDNFCLACLDRGWNRLPFHIASPDSFEAVRAVWQEAVSRGYRRVGCAIIRHTPPALDDARRTGAAMYAQSEWVPRKDRVPLLRVRADDRDAFMRWYHRHLPDAVIGLQVEQYEWLVDAGIRVPEDVGFAIVLGTNARYPELSGTSAMTEETGAAGVDLLVNVMNRNDWGIPANQRWVLLEPVWREGVSLPLKRRRSPGAESAEAAFVGVS